MSGCKIYLKPCVLADWSKGKLNPLLLKVMVASGLRIVDELPESQATAKAWVQEAQHDLLRHIGKQSVSQLQALVVIIRFHYVVGEVSDAWNLLSLAARLIFTMRLNWEDDGLDAVTQETQRRLVWAIYLIDRQFSGGIEDLAVCAVERMHIRLPCDDHSFRRGMKSKAEYLHDIARCKSGDMDILSYNVRLVASRDRILRYTKRVRRGCSSPADSTDEATVLHKELDDFAEALPDDLKLTSERLLYMSHSDEASEYIALHTIWLQCYCDLYRFLIA
ncbi:hypothetical protein BN1723_006590 [Verticillium longisporum]|uniref:Xylanolytic transcriptional activator regulatory domain-containing protein n=1 Tax=Verticillium longisporum TaxID=100787 RepID=A0A0G4NG16_VERLO|nr:hypothetical protein BN1708_014529 [Verticillium longisporum]CRK45363.1 hypothetical protein BN1723_006590 [Verticillium longisporum]